MAVSFLQVLPFISTQSWTEILFSPSYTETIADPQSAEEAMRGTTARNMPEMPPSFHTSKATARKVFA